MRIAFACLIGLLASGSLACSAAPPGGSTPRGAAGPGAAADVDLQRRLARGEADPVADARRAARSGDFRFVWVVGLGFRHPMGLTCNVTFYPGAGQALVTRSVSDTVPDGCESTPGACEHQKRLDVYGVAYNRALVDAPQFPAPDVCRPSTPADGSRSQRDAVLRQVDPVREVRSSPHDIHEAARRGTVADVKRLAQDASAANTVDMFGYTPLAWAVARNRPDVIKALLAAGADPYPDLEGPRRPWGTPLWLGCRLGRADAVRLMLAKMEPGSIDEGAGDLVTAAVEGGDATILRAVLGRAPAGERIVLPYHEALKAGRRDLLDVLVASDRFRADDLLAAAARIGDLEVARMAIAKRGDVHGEGTPIGSVILGVHEADEALLEALIQAGADVNKTTVGNNLSGPPLRIAVQHAYRAPFPSDEDRRTAERQQRIIMRLIQKGARDDTRYPEQAPLAFVAVIGWNARNDPSPNALVAPLPPEVLRALTRGGMDLNATYRGRTVLQWVQSVQPASALVDDLRSMGAR